MSCFQSEGKEEQLYIDLLGDILDGVLSESEDQEPGQDLFSSNKIPDITIRDYIQRVKTKAQCSNDTLIMALIYIDRYTQADPTFKLSPFSIHRYTLRDCRLLLVSILTAAKIHEDFYYDNNTFAMAGGVPVKHINELQLHFQKTLDFKAFILADEFNDYKRKMLQAFQ